MPPILGLFKMLNTQTKSVLFKVLNTDHFLEDSFYIIIESDGINPPHVLTDNDGYTLKFYNYDTIKKVIETLNKTVLTHYYLEKITF